MNTNLDEKLREVFLSDFFQYLQVLKKTELGELDIVDGIEQSTALIQDIIADFHVLDLDLYMRFLVERNKISLRIKERKEARLAQMEPVKDPIDLRNVRRMILVQYDLPKHQAFLELAKNLAYESGWLK